VVIRRGQIWWANLGIPFGSEAGHRRPVLVVQADDFNESRIATVVVAPITSSIGLAQAKGNVFLARGASGLKKPSVVNVSLVAAVDRARLTEKISHLGPETMRDVEAGLRLVLSL
jgi:mRNA interferase MazF